MNPIRSQLAARSTNAHPVTLQETESEYLLFIHASERARAKRIEGWQWDAQRRCWVYPHVARAYSSLVAEFGDELQDRTTGALAASAERSQNMDNTEIEQNIASATANGQDSLTIRSDDANPLQSTVDTLTAAGTQYQAELTQAKHETAAFAGHLVEAHHEIQQFKAQLAATQRGPELAKLLAMLEEKERQIIEQRASIDRQAAEHLTLQAQVRETQAEITRLTNVLQDATPNDAAKTFLLKLARISSGGDPSFVKIIVGQEFDATLPNFLTNEMAVAVARLLRDGGSSPTLHGILLEAREEGVLNEDQLDLAHFIRRQRNIIAHQRMSKSSTTARVLLTLFAAALLWPEFVEKDTPKPGL